VRIIVCASLASGFWVVQITPLMLARRKPRVVGRDVDFDSSSRRICGSSGRPTRPFGGASTVGSMDRALFLLRHYWAELFALFVGVVGVIDAVANPYGYEGVDKGTDWLVWLTPAAVAAPLLFRRRFPFGAPATAIVLAVVASFATTGEAVTDGFGAIFIIAACAWLFGELDTRSAGVGLLLIYAAGTLVNLNSVDVVWGDFVFPALLFTLFWGASRALAVRGHNLRDAEARARRLTAERDAEAQRAVTEERQRIARELHDVIAHSVSVMTVQTGAVRRLLKPDQVKEREALETVEATGRQALTEMRRLVGLLREQGAMPEFSPQPGMATIDSLLDGVRAAGLPVELEVDGEPRDIPPGVDLAAYRVVQEALTNALKYAGPAHAWVAVNWGDAELGLEISNDGRGDGDGTGGGHGLAGMRERVSLYGGDIESGPRDGGGYVVRARLPLEEEAA
jgi:signal transduction histidine kinase